MKMIEAIIKPSKLEEVKEALLTLGVRGLTVSEVRGFGRQKGHRSQYRGTEYRVDLVPKTRVQIIVGDDAAAHLSEVIARVARTGETGDGKIFVLPLDQVMRIRTGEMGESAV
jgi:nitrogen regulatory protein P-II 1